MKNLQIEMKRKGGYGQYVIIATFDHNGEAQTTSKHSTDSQLFDEIADLAIENKYAKIQTRLQYIIGEQIEEKIEELNYFEQ